MRPIRLEVEHLRNFRQNRIVDFSGLEIVAILGDTGAGKSSILEAITYALFNRPTWNGRDVKELITKNATSMSVAFTFTIGGEEYVVQRITRLRGASVHRLMCRSRGLDVNGEAAVNAAVQAALHLDDEAFVHTVMLRQDMHAALLTATESKRTAILSELFRLDDVAKVSDAARTHEGEAETYLYSFRTRRHECGDDPSRKSQDAAEALTRASQLAEKARAAVERAKVIDKEFVACSELIELSRSQMLALAPAPGLLNALDRIAHIERALAPNSATLREELKRSETAKRDAEKEALQLRADGRDADALRKIESAFEALQADLREAASEQVRVRDASAEADAMLAHLSELQLLVVGAEKEQAEASASLNAAEAAQRELESRKHELQILLKDRANAQSRHDTWLSSRDRTTSQEAALRDKLAAKETALGAAHDALEKASATHLKAQVADGAAAIARHLHAGDSCPVCARVLPKDFTPPRKAALEKAKSAEENARKQLAELTAEKNQLDGEIVAVVKTLRESSEQVAAARVELAEVDKRVEAALPKAKGDPTEVLAQWQKAISDSNRQTPSLRSIVEQTSNALSALRSKSAAAEADLRNLRKSITDLVASLEARGNRCEQIVAGLPPNFRPKLSESDIENALTTLKASYELANSVNLRVQGANEAIAAASTKINELDQQITSQVVVPREALYEKLRVIGALLDVPNVPGSQVKREKWAHSVVERATARRAELDQAVAKTATRRDDLLRAREQLVTELGGEPHEVAAETALRKRDAERDVEAAKGIVELAASLDAKIERLEPIKAGLTSLRGTLSAREFPAYATQQRQRRLLEEATIIFREMTDERYGFTAEFEIFDGQMNKARAAETLSGGEKFLASLALSL
ncbi:MAG TPA: SMC family ATPase, partial [Candidatus Acidoferrales bacterium]|nr:SMC family ATPase [Candidatus Acidoferrales bacterium]